MTAQPNNSMDVRAKQRLSLNGVCFPSDCVVAVSPHVISIVGRLLSKTKRAFIMAKQLTFSFLILGLCAFNAFSQSQVALETDSNLYVKALSACYTEQAKTAQNIQPENRYEFYNRVIEQDNSLTKNLPTQFGEFKIEYLNRKSIADKYKKNKQVFGVRVVNPMHNDGATIRVSFSDFIVSYKKRVYNYGLEGGCIVEFKFDCPLGKFIIAKTDLWGV